jgi:hypothetical protein
MVVTQHPTKMLLGLAPSAPARMRARTGLGTMTTATAFFIAALSWSPLLPALFSIPFSVALLASSLGMMILTGSVPGTSRAIALVCGVMLIIAVAMFAITQSSNLLLRTAPLPLLIFSAYQARLVEGLPDALCTWLTRFMVVGVAGAIVGFVYAYLGGAPLLEIANIDGRENGLYLSTMSNVYLLGIIRPSFIYDEAGAFSFILCATVALRALLGRSAGPSYFLMLGGLITFSVAHILLTLVFLGFRLGPAKTVAAVAALLVVLVPVAATSEEFEFFFSRFEVADGQLSGDNRSIQIANFIDVVSPRILLFGDVDCHSRVDGNCEEHGDISSSPVTPTYKGGIVALLVQLAVHIGLAAAFIRHSRFRFVALVLTLLLLQRPYFDITGYGFMTYLMLFLMLDRPVETRKPS